MGGHGVDSSGLAKNQSMICMLHKRTDTHLFPAFPYGFKVSLAAQVLSHTVAAWLNILVSAGKKSVFTHSFV